jgi:hypothetical protein
MYNPKIEAERSGVYEVQLKLKGDTDFDNIKKLVLQNWDPLSKLTGSTVKRTGISFRQDRC